jgi:hypothetical protein
MDTNRNRGGLVIGGVLIGVGLLLALAQMTGFASTGLLWPFFVIGVGIAFFAGMALGGRNFSGLAIPGSIFITIGLILFFQNLLGWWETWSYAWALIVAGVGVGVVIHGAVSGQPDVRRGGWKTVQTGLALFLVFGAIFEFVFSFTGGSRGGPLLWAILLGLAGLFLFAARVARLLADREQASHEDYNLFWPVLLMGIGAVAALTQLGTLPSGKFFLLVSLWPLLLVAAGIQLLVGRRNAWVSAFLGLLMVAVMFGAVLYGEQLGLRSTPFFSIHTDDGFYIGPTNDVRGSGTITEEKRPVSGFDKISLASIGELEIVQSDQEGITVVADENLLPYITTETHGQTLVIDVKPGYNLVPLESVRYVVRVKDLQEVRVSGAGSVKIDGLQANSLNLIASGVGNYTVHDLQADALTARISGTGDISVDGQVDRLTVGVSGAGGFKSPDLKAARADVKISGLGGVTVWATEALDVNISGAGSVRYYGSPQVNQNRSGVGSVTHLGDK